MKKIGVNHTSFSLATKVLTALFFLFFFRSFSIAQTDTSALNAQLVQAKSLLYTNPTQAQLQLVQLAESAKQNNVAKVELDVCRQLAIIFINNGKYANAREYIIRGIALAEANAKGNEKADLIYFNATIYHAQGDISKAVENYLEALRFFETNNQALGKLNVFVALADIYNRQNNFSRAIEYNLKALKLFEQKDDKFRQLNIYEQVGAIYARQLQFEKADEYYKKALRIYRDINNQAGESATLINLASLQVLQGKPDLAIKNYQSAYGIAHPLNIVPLEIRSLIGLATSHLKSKDYEQANIEFRKAIVLAKKAGMKIELDEAYEGLAEVYKSLKDPGTSKTFRSLSSEIKDSLFNDSILKKTSDLQLLYETEKKQAQIEIMGKEDKLKELDLKQTRQDKNFLITLSVLLIILVVVFVFFISQNKIINRKLNIGLHDLKIKNIEIEIQKEQLTQLNQVKDRFFSIISHDLRNNLTTMKLYFDLVSNPDYRAESQSKLGKEVAGSVQNTIDLLENLLVWAAGQIKGVQAEPKRISLHKLGQENCQMLMSMAVQKSIILQNETDEDAFIMADLNMVNLILRNLISNALKFTNEGGNVSILSQEEGDFHQIIVIDNGMGISAEKVETLFTQHNNVSTQGTGNEKGTGLGLMLCKEFVEKNGGQIWVESEEGKGSSFYFTFLKG
jgi:signal transduction histidine kinase/Tfp pilus assembly protein PilF